MIKTTLLALIILCCSIFFPLALAQESSPGTLIPTPSPIDYALPYPGILPDHPLFAIKALRDSLLSILIQDPVKKVEFSQLMTDKYINMATFLTEKGKLDMAIVTFKKAEKHLDQTKSQIEVLPQTNADQVGNVKNKFIKSLDKYDEVLTEIAPKFSQEDQVFFTQFQLKLQNIK